MVNLKVTRPEIHNSRLYSSRRRGCRRRIGKAYNSLVLVFRYFASYVRQVFLAKGRAKFVAQDNWVLSRTACLGNDVFQELKCHQSFRLNLQKGRIDHLVRQYQGVPPKGAGIFAHRFFKRKDILSLVWQQRNNSWLSMPPPKLILFDSFSELTDQKFVEVQSGRTFYCHRSDLLDSSFSSQKILSEGVIELANIEEMYADLFQYFRTKWGGFRLFLFIFRLYWKNVNFICSGPD